MFLVHKNGLGVWSSLKYSTLKVFILRKKIFFQSGLLDLNSVHSTFVKSPTCTDTYCSFHSKDVAVMVDPR